MSSTPIRREWEQIDEAVYRWSQGWVPNPPLPSNPPPPPSVVPPMRRPDVVERVVRDEEEEKDTTAPKLPERKRKEREPDIVEARQKDWDIYSFSYDDLMTRLDKVRKRNATPVDAKEAAAMYDEALNYVGSLESEKKIRSDAERDAKTSLWSASESSEGLRQRQAMDLDEAERGLQDLERRIDSSVLEAYAEKIAPNPRERFLKEKKEREERQAIADEQRWDAATAKALAQSSLEGLPRGIPERFSAEVKTKTEADVLIQSTIDTLCDQLRMQRDVIKALGEKNSGDIITAFYANVQTLSDMTNGEHPMMYELLDEPWTQ
jgi:hypothetical protein